MQVSLHHCRSWHDHGDTKPQPCCKSQLFSKLVESHSDMTSYLLKKLGQEVLHGCCPLSWMWPDSGWGSDVFSLHQSLHPNHPAAPWAVASKPSWSSFILTRYIPRSCRQLYWHSHRVANGPDIVEGSRKDGPGHQEKCPCKCVCGEGAALPSHLTLWHWDKLSGTCFPLLWLHPSCSCARAISQCCKSHQLRAQDSHKRNHQLPTAD